MGDLKLRQALKTDAADLAMLDNLAGFGLSLWFWQQAGNISRVEDAYALGRERLANEDAFYGWRSARVATEDEMILGMSTSYIVPAPDGEDAKEIKRTAPAFVPVFDLHDEVIGDWFLDCLAVYPQARGRGVGALLLDDFISRGRMCGTTKASLIVEDSNDTAKKLYLSRGFEVIDARAFVEFDGPSKTKEWQLMSVKL